jgi:multidrug efflux pump subunit AcrA (membrane-fusion protein)
VSLAQSLKGSAEEVFPMRAPFAGTVVQVLKTEGEYVDQSSTPSGSSIVRIDDLSHLFIEANAPETEVGKLKIGQEVLIKASAVLGQSYTGKIRKISLAAKEQKDWDKSRVEFSIWIQVVENDRLLKPGMSVIVDVITRKLTDVLTLRHEFVQRDKDKYFVIGPKGVHKNIEVGIQNEEVFEIKKGLVEGEKVRQIDFLSLIKDQ